MKKKILPLVKLGSLASALQFLLILLFAMTSLKFGLRPETAIEAFEAFEKGSVYGLMKDELLIIIMLSLYFVSFSALFFVLKNHRFTTVFLAVLFTFAAVLLTLATHSGFSLMHLSHLYKEAIDENVKNQILAAGEAVLASNMWNGTSSYFSGFLLQGGGVMISLAMMGSGRFKMITIISGIMGNGLDLIQHAIHHWIPGPAEILLRIAGPFYLMWYVMLAIDLFKCSQSHMGKKED